MHVQAGDSLLTTYFFYKGYFFSTKGCSIDAEEAQLSQTRCGLVRKSAGGWVACATSRTGCGLFFFSCQALNVQAVDTMESRSGSSR